jgi:hypothetical protein
MADSSRHNLYYVPEVTYGTTPATPALTKIRHTGCNLGLSKNTVVSDEIRSDRQIADFRHGTKQTGGDVNTELSFDSHADLIEAVMCGTWSTPASPVTAATISAASADNSINDSGAGLPVVAAGDVIRIAGFTGSTGNNGIATVVSRTASKIVISGITLVNDAAGESVTVTPAKMLKAGTTRRSFSVLRDFSDITTGRYHLFDGQEVNKLALKVAPNAIVIADFGFVGQSLAIGDSAPASATFPAPTTTSPMDSFTGAVRVGGVAIAIITEISLTLENGIQPRFVVGSAETIRPSIGRSNLTGQLGLYFEDSALVNNFINEDVVVPEFVLTDGAAGNSYVFNLPRIKFTGGQPDVKGQGPVMLTMPFQAIYDPTVASQLRIARVAA